MIKYDRVNKMVSLVRKDNLSTVIKAILSENLMMQKYGFDFDVEILEDSNIRLYVNDTLRDWLNGNI